MHRTVVAVLHRGRYQGCTANAFLVLKHFFGRVDEWKVEKDQNSHLLGTANQSTVTWVSSLT